MSFGFGGLSAVGDSSVLGIAKNVRASTAC
jgi:hypothetical protein